MTTIMKDRLQRRILPYMACIWKLSKRVMAITECKVVHRNAISNINLKNILLVFMMLYCININAQLFPFREVNKKWNISVNGGYNHSSEVGVYGFALTIKGFHITIGGTGSTHENDVSVGKWEEKSSAIIHAGYQIPITKAIRIIPVIGASGASEVITDGYDYIISSGAVHNKTYSDIKYKLDFGAHIVLNPYKKMIINLAGTKYTLYAGVGLEF